jgi:hypothetical protein
MNKLMPVTLQNVDTGEILHTQRDESGLFTYNLKGEWMYDGEFQKLGWWELPKSLEGKKRLVKVTLQHRKTGELLEALRDESGLFRYKINGDWFSESILFGDGWQLAHLPENSISQVISKKRLVKVVFKHQDTGEMLYTQRNDFCVWTYNFFGQWLCEEELFEKGLVQIAN